MGRFEVEICFTKPRQDRLCAAGALVEGVVEVGMIAEVEGHVARRTAEVVAVEELELKSGRTVDVLVFALGGAPWRPFQVDGRVLILRWGGA